MRYGSLKELDAVIDPETKLILDLCTVTGIGEKTARDFMATGIVSVEDLLEKYKSGKYQVTHHISVGLDYYYDLKERMSWNEADMIAQNLRFIPS